MNERLLTEQVKALAGQLGFGPVGVCPAVAPTGLARFDQWLAGGYAGQMQYLPGRRAAYEHPRHVLDGVQSIVVLALGYRTQDPAATQPLRGRISRYAWGCDYHDVVRRRLDRLADLLRAQHPPAQVRGVVDTAPLFERELAQLAGLGWIGKHTLLINKPEGSWFFLAALLTDLVLDYDASFAADHCGTCRACLDACPTDAFVAPYVLDPRRCISYLTIESRGPIPRELRGGIGDWLFGCDVCQEVCPWNHRAPRSTEPPFEPREGQATCDLIELLALDEAQFRARFRDTPLWRPKRRGLLRNAAIVLGNQLPLEAIAPLTHALGDTEAVVRGAAAWAIGRYRLDVTRRALQTRLSCEDDPEVREEIVWALGEADE